MNKQLKTKATTEDRKLILTRDFNAPQELLFEMWSDCKHLKHWWGPKEWPMHECEMEFKEGGEWHYCLRGPNDGDESWGKAFYKEIVRPSKIVYEDYFSNKEGTVNREMPGMLITVEFIGQGEQTKLVSTTLFDTPDTLKSIVEMGVVEGMDSSLDRLEKLLESSQ